MAQGAGGGHAAAHEHRQWDERHRDESFGERHELGRYCDHEQGGCHSEERTSYGKG